MSLLPATTSFRTLMRGIGVFLMLLLLGPLAHAEDQERAEELNRKGKVKIQELDLDGAAKLFREALSHHSDARYAFNLCYTLEKSGYVDEAEEHCEFAQQHGEESVVYKATQVLKQIAARQKSAAKPGTSAPQTPPPARPPADTAAPDTAAPPRPLLALPTPKEPKLRYGGFVGFLNNGGSSSSVNVGGGLIQNTTGRHSFVLTGELLRRRADSVFRDDRPAEVLFLDVSPSVRFAIFRNGSLYFEAGLNLGLRLYVDSADVALDEVPVLHYGYVLGLGLALPIYEHVVDLRFRIVPSVSDVVEATDDGSARGSVTLAFGAGLWW